jgi:hypothetical protein
MLDRINIHIEVSRVDYEKLSSDCLGESSASIRGPGEGCVGAAENPLGGSDDRPMYITDVFEHHGNLWKFRCPG